MKKYFIILIFTLLLLSCDCYHIAQGVIIDKETNLPLTNIEVSGKHGHKTLTDSMGYFSLSYVTGHKTPYIIYIKNEGYKSSEVSFENEKEQVIEIEKIK